MVKTYELAAKITLRDELSSKLAVIGASHFDGRAHPTPVDIGIQSI